MTLGEVPTGSGPGPGRGQSTAGDPGNVSASLSSGLEARLLAAVEQAVIATDTRGTILFWNRYAEQLYGWSWQEVLGRSVTDVVPAVTTRQQAEDIMAALGRGESWRGEFEVSRKDGSTFTAMVTDSPLVMDGQVVGMVGVSADVSERRRLEDALRTSERRLRVLFESIDEGYCLAEMLVDEQGRPRDYRFLEVNRLFEAMTGLSDALGRTALELVPDLEPVWVQTYARVGLDRQTLRFEQGSAAMGRWFDVFAVPVDPAPRFAIVFKDQTERRRAEEVLRESEARFRVMTDRLPLLVWQNGPDGALEWVNQTFCDFFGVSREQMPADRWTTLTDPETGRKYLEDFEAAVIRRSPFRGQVKVRDGAGRWRWLESWGEPRYSAGGEYLGHLGVSADITDRVEAEETLRRNHEFVSELTALVPGVIYVFDVQQRSTVFVNRAASEALGYSPEQIQALGAEFLPKVLHPDDGEAFEAHLRLLHGLPDGQTAAWEYRFRHRDGDWRWFAAQDVVLTRDAQGLARQVLGIATDVSARKAQEAALRAEAALAAYRARLLDALRAISDPVEVQAQACRLLGEHVQASGVHFAQVLQHGYAGAVSAGYQPHGAPLTGNYRLEHFGVAVLAEFRAGRTVVVDDVRTDPRLTDDERRASMALGVASYVMTPLSAVAGPVMALIVHRDHAQPWAPHHLSMIAVTAERTWMVVEQARAYQAARAAHRRAELVADVVGALEAESNHARQLQRLAEVLVPRLADYATVEVPGGADVVQGLAHRDPRRVETLRTLRHRHRLPAGSTGSVYRAALGEAQLVTRIDPTLVSESALDEQPARLLDELAPHSHMAVPLHVSDQAPGVLTVGLTDPERPGYTPDDLDFLQQISRRAEVILAAAEVRRREHDIAVRLQRAMLPDHLVQHPRLRIAARYQAAGDMLEVGGDWYDTVTWPSGHIGVIVGDIVGHNLESAAAMGRLRAATAALAAHVPPDPAALLDAVNHFATSRDGMDFATAACVVVQPDTGEIAYSSAGHPPVLVLDSAGEGVWLDDVDHPPLTVGTAPHPRAVRTLAAGSAVVIYTDGLVERRGESLQQGLERLADVAAAAVPDNSDADALADRLLDTLTQHSSTEDDVVLVCLRYLEPDNA